MSNEKPTTLEEIRAKLVRAREHFDAAKPYLNAWKTRENAKPETDIERARRQA